MGYSSEDTVAYMNKLDQLKLIYQMKDEFQQMELKIAKDVPRTQFMSSKFGRNLIDLFINDLQNGTGIYEFLSEEVRPLNKLLF